MSFWDDIKPMSPTSKERIGYPTQKPEKLLERIITATSNEGDISEVSWERVHGHCAHGRRLGGIADWLDNG